MSLFKDMLRSDESLFVNTVALDYDYQPKLVPYREDKQRKIALCIKPLFQKANGRNLLIYGPPGVGKTVACKHVLAELEEETDEIVPIYVNCWTFNTTYKMFMYMCEQLGHKFVQNKKTDELFSLLQKELNKKSVVFLFDEADKVEDFDYLYTLLEGIYRKSIIMITNFGDWINEIDDRIKSRLVPEIEEFKPYSAAETKGILHERLNYAFVPNVWDSDALQKVVEKTAIIKDIRSGLYLLKEAGRAAEDESSRRITLKHVDTAVQKFDTFSIKASDDLEDETHAILQLVKAHSGKKIGDLFRLYQQSNGQRGYKYFQRKIAKLEAGKFVSLTKVQGREGNTTIVTYLGDKIKKLSDF